LVRASSELTSFDGQIPPSPWIAPHLFSNLAKSPS
jgi:hypothetical protein